MKPTATSRSLPLGGFVSSSRRLQPWRWSDNGALTAQPVRCRKEQWYQARAVADAPGCRRAAVRIRFLADGEPLVEHCIRLDALPSRKGVTPLGGWVQSPPNATHVQLGLLDGNVDALRKLVLRSAAERDPKCHPGANLPRWGTYQPPFPLDRLVLPEALKLLAGSVPQRQLDVLRTPVSVRKLAASCMGAAVILDPAWVRALSITPQTLEQLASMAYVLIDLESLVWVLRRGGVRGIECRGSATAHAIMSARVLYADLATRGFALEDAFPYAALDERERYATRAITMNRAWKRYADEHEFAPLLASETPWISRSGDVLAAVRAVGRGELLATDTPWLAAGAFGPPLAPQLAAHVLRMQLGGSIADDVQYWNRWDDTRIVVRDLMELARRYPPLRPERWNSPDGATARLGLTLPAVETSERHVLVNTGRIDDLTPHAGLAPESLAIFMKWLAREVRELTPWAVKHLQHTTMTLQFDTAAGLRYGHTYEAAPPVGVRGAERRFSLCWAGGRRTARECELPIADDVGLFGDGSHGFQERLSKLLRGVIETAGRV